MGYSCTKKADDSFRRLMDMQKAIPGQYSDAGNCWEFEGKLYMYERGRENRDGSITGTVLRFVSHALLEANRVGSFKIDADGTVLRFPGTSKHTRATASNPPAFWTIERSVGACI